MTGKKKIKALLQLVDDPDLNVYEVVEHEILKQDSGIIRQLEEVWDSVTDEFTQQRIENLIQKLQFRETKKQFRTWTNSPELPVLKGFEIVTRYQYPDLNFMLLESRFENLKKEIWLELSNSLTALEKITVVNHILFTIHKFSVNHSVPESPRNYFLNQILETKLCSPTAITILYLALAQALELPVKYIPYPKNPLLGYVDRELAIHILGENAFSNVIFYINPANRGSITSRKELEYHLKKNNYIPVEDYVEPMNERHLLMRLLESLSGAYAENRLKHKAQEVMDLSDILTLRSKG
jgi:regulator of sirC expression with transglutaminase-like and TPR domain